MLPDDAGSGPAGRARKVGAGDTATIATIPKRAHDLRLVIPAALHALDSAARGGNAGIQPVCGVWPPPPPQGSPFSVTGPASVANAADPLSRHKVARILTNRANMAILLARNANYAPIKAEPCQKNFLRIWLQR